MCRSLDVITGGISSPSEHSPSRLWTAFAWATLVAALAAASASWVIYTRAQRPVGEGELFSSDGRRAVELYQESSDGVRDRLRHIRNELTIEAVSIIEGGTITHSTSSTLVGAEPSSQLLTSAIERHRFAAIAAPSPAPIQVDDVVEWPAGAVLYDVVQPLSESSGLLLTYDLAELLSRRASTMGVPALSVQLAVLFGLFVLASVVVFWSRARAIRVHRELAIEAEFLSRHASTLAEHNVELEQARAAAEQALELAEEKNRIRSEFVLMINHEFRTPLTGVVTGSRLLQELDLPEPAPEIVDDVIDEGQRLEHLMAQMLAVARVENRGLFVSNVPTSMRGIAAALRKAPHRPGVSVRLDPAHLEMKVETDRTTLVQLASSLADNALQHGAATVQLSTSSRLPFESMLEVGMRPDPCLYLLVCDDGPGIDPGFLPRAFEKFEKRSFSSGTGLGLYLARLMAEALGASISVTTGTQGTTMAIGIPCLERAELSA